MSPKNRPSARCRALLLELSRYLDGELTPSQRRMVERQDVRGIGEPAIHLVCEHGRRDHALSVRMRRFGRRQHGRDVVARVSRNDAGVAVVVIEVPDHDAIHEGGEIRARRLAAADDRRAAPAAAKGRCQVAGDLARLARVGADGATDGVYDEALRLAYDLDRKIAGLQRAGVFAES